MAGLVNAVGTAGPVISAAMHARFLVVPPTPARREAQSTDDPLSDYSFAGRRIMGQVEQDSTRGGNPLWAPHSLANSGPGSAAILEASMPSYLTVGVDPYRIDDGDYWFDLHHLPCLSF